MVKISTKRDNSAVSPIIAVLVLILLAIGAGTVVYAYVFEYLGTSTTAVGSAQGTLAVENLDILVESAGGNVTIYIRNVGGIPVNLATASVFLTTPAGATEKGTVVTGLGFSSPINPGSTDSAKYSFTTVPVAGQVYTIEVIGDDGTTVVASSKAHS